MNTAEALMLLRKVKAHCPSQLIDEYTPEAWAEVLDDIRFDDAKEAVVRICKRPLELGKSRYIEPGHIIGEVSALRRDRVEDYGRVEYPDDMPAYPTAKNGPEFWDSIVTVDRQRIAYECHIRQLVADGVLVRGDAQPTFRQVEASLKALPAGRGGR